MAARGSRANITESYTRNVPSSAASISPQWGSSRKVQANGTPAR